MNERRRPNGSTFYLPYSATVGVRTIHSRTVFQRSAVIDLNPGGGASLRCLSCASYAGGLKLSICDRGTELRSPGWSGLQLKLQPSSSDVEIDQINSRVSPCG
jgi:hypothetical protein